MGRFLWLLGLAKVLTSLGTAWNTRWQQQEGLSASWGSCSTGPSAREAAAGLGNAHHLCPDPGILWGVGQGEALGCEEGFTRDLFLPSPWLRARCCAQAGAESALGNYSLAEASPAPLGAGLSQAPCQGINCP